MGQDGEGGVRPRGHDAARRRLALRWTCSISVGVGEGLPGSVAAMTFSAGRSGPGRHVRRGRRTGRRSGTGGCDGPRRLTSRRSSCRRRPSAPSAHCLRTRSFTEVGQRHVVQLVGHLVAVDVGPVAPTGCLTAVPCGSPRRIRVRPWTAPSGRERHGRYTPGNPLRRPQQDGACLPPGRAAGAPHRGPVGGHCLLYPFAWRRVADVGFAGRHHAFTGRRRMAGDQRVRDRLPLVDRVGSGAGEVRRAGADLRHAGRPRSSPW